MQQQIPRSNFESSTQREKVNLNVGTATKQLEAWRSWESSDRTGCEYLYSDLKKTPVARAKRPVTD